MCGRYYIDTEASDEEMQAILAQMGQKAAAKDIAWKSGEIFPSDLVPVLANNKSLVPTIFAMQWGFPHPTGKGLIINARAETAMQKPLFRVSAQKRRCLIPANTYFEWEKSSAKKTKYAIKPKGSAGIYLAGLYMLDGPSKPARFVILTRPVAKEIAFLHDRMPVILPKEKIAAWLSPENKFDALIAEAMEEMEFHAC